ncbi:MAG TPA: GntR family transcriptional regulator [Candidatus Fournierella merdigallinarum]|nr:GntR family transcriptional regulator [Candidatus Fournierella merdigallinarum]
MTVYTPLQQRAYEYLKDSILSGRLSRDDVYSEARFARELKMSRTPVREALQRLVQEGYVDVLPSRGFMIHPLTEKDIVAMYQMRTAIECFCLAWYADQPDRPVVQRLLTLLRENLACQQRCLAGQAPLEDYYKCDCEFHRLIVMLMENPWFNEAFEKYVRQFQLMTRMTMDRLERIDRSVREHEEICEIIAQGRRHEVFSWMHRHLAFPTRVTLDLVKNG